MRSGARVAEINILISTKLGNMRHNFLSLVIVVCAASLYFTEANAQASSDKAQEAKSILYVKERSPGIELRLYDPATRKDQMFLALTGIPRHLYWRDSFRSAYYALGRSVYEVQWKFGSQPVELFSLPLIGNTNQLADVWVDKNTKRWRVLLNESFKPTDVIVSQENGREKVYLIYHGERILVTGNFYKEYPRLMSILERDSDGSWHIVARRTTACEAFDDPCMSVMDDLIHKQEVISLGQLFGSMLVEENLSTMQWIEGSAHSGVAYLPSKTVRNKGLKVIVMTGDTRHAIAPLIHVSKDNGQEKTIYDLPKQCDDFQQIAFAESRGYLLIGTEYDGHCSRLVDMKTGEIVNEFPASTFAVWVSPPANPN